MSKFDFELMGNDEYTAVVFNKERWSKENALKQGRLELGILDHEKLEIFGSYARFGFFKLEGQEISNSWFIDSLITPVELKAKNSVAVWVVRVCDDE